MHKKDEEKLPYLATCSVCMDNAGSVVFLRVGTEAGYGKKFFGSQ